MVGWSRGGGIGLGLGVDSSSLVCDIGDISIIAVGRVLDMLDTSIGKSNGVGAGNVGGTIGLLGGVEVGLGVVISHGVGEGVGGDLIGVLLGLVGGGGGVVGRGGLHDNGGNDGGGVDSVGNNGGVHSVGNHGGVVHGVSHGVGNHGGVHGVDGVVDGGVVDSVVHGVGNQLVSTIGAGSNHGEQSSSDESLKIFDPLKKYSLEHSKIFNAFRNF